MYKQWIISIFLHFLSLSLNDCQQPSTYKVAVLEHESVPFKDSLLDTILDNVKIYSEKAALAAQQGASIIVFPEYGLLGLGEPPETWYESLEDDFVDLPKEADGTVPCYHDPPTQLNNYQILKELSCISANNSIALIVNQLTRELCDSVATPGCPSRGYYQFNTNIIFSQNGTILGRYHKRHLFRESNLNPAPEPEFEIVDFGFAKFGTFICFDMLYADPAVQYATEHGIKNILFSTAWIDELPFLTSPQLFTQFARGLGINLVVSNAYNPPIARLGSGMYSSQLGGIQEAYDLAVPGHLLVAELPADPQPVPTETFSCAFNSVNISPPQTAQNESKYVPYVLTDVPTSSPNVSKIHKVYYQALSNFTYLFLEEGEQGQKILCKDDLCCQLEYKTSDSDGTVYAFAIHNGIHSFNIYRMYSQVCSVLRCESRDIETCGRVPQTNTSTRFEKLNLSGAFATNFTFPSILGTDLLPVSSSEWDFSKGPCDYNRSFFVSGAKIAINVPMSKPILVASIYARVYNRDEEPAESHDH